MKTIIFIQYIQAWLVIKLYDIYSKFPRSALAAALVREQLLGPDISSVICER